LIKYNIYRNFTFFAAAPAVSLVLDVIRQVSIA